MQTKLLVDTSCPASDVIASHLDSSGGMAITAPGIRKLQLIQEGLRALDVHSSSELTELDLSYCRSQEFHLTLIDCPNLKAVRLPNGGGAYVHIDSSYAPEALNLTGGVRHIDANWCQLTFSTDSVSSTIWHEVWIGSATEEKKGGQSDEHRSLGILVNASGSRGTLTLDSAATDLIICGSERIERIFIKSAHDFIKVSNAPRLSAADFDKTVQQIVFDRCPTLSSIAGNGDIRALELKSCSGARHLQVSVSPCTDVLLSDSATVSVSLVKTERLRLIRCRNLEIINAQSELDLECESCIPVCILDQTFRSLSFSVDETDLTDIEARCLRRDDRAFKQFEVALPFASHGRLLPKCLKHIAYMANRGVASNNWFWHCRNTLHSRNQSGNPDGWSWNMPADLGEDGWRADLEIWLACDDLPEARSYGEKIADGILLNKNVPDSILSGLSIRTALYQSTHSHLFTRLFQRGKGLTLDNRKQEKLLMLSEIVGRTDAFNRPEFFPLRQSANDFFVAHGSFPRLIEYFSTRLLLSTPENRARIRVQINQLINGMSEGTHREASKMTKSSFVSELQRLLLS